jgi:predicted RNA-binding Zn ribbon-like protein
MELAIVEAFVNTADLNAGTDALADVAGLEQWAAGLGHTGFDEADRVRVVAFREALRRLLLDKQDAEAIAALDHEARSAPLRVAFEPDGSARLAPAARGADGLIAALLAVVARAQADGTWSRLKACAAEDCHWAFYDRSRNRSRTWCSMSECGNRAKARSYRARQR